MPAIARDRALDAADVLNDFIGDFITGVMVFREYEVDERARKVPLVMMVGIQKMCLSHLVLAFAKFEEFWRHYHDVVPVAHHEACNVIRKKIRDLKITKFRNQCVGHIWSNDAQCPLRHSEVLQALQAMVNQDFGAFLQWINNPNANTYPSTVVSVMEVVRDAIVAQHYISPDEIVNR